MYQPCNKTRSRVIKPSIPDISGVCTHVFTHQLSVASKQGKKGMLTAEFGEGMLTEESGEEGNADFKTDKV